MKKRLSHFAYNERSRSGWTLSSPRFTSLSPLRSTIKELLPMSPARLLLLSLVRTKGKRGGFAFGLCRSSCLDFLDELLRYHASPFSGNLRALRLRAQDRPSSTLPLNPPALRT